MKRSLVIIAVVLGAPIMGVVIYFVAYFTVPPSFSASAQRQPNGDYRIAIDPNFVVYSVYTVVVRDTRGVLAERSEPREGPQDIIVSGSTPTGTMVTVECSLVYDRPMPSITSHSVTVQLP